MENLDLGPLGPDDWRANQEEKKIPSSNGASNPSKPSKSSNPSKPTSNGASRHPVPRDHIVNFLRQQEQAKVIYPNPVPSSNGAPKHPVLSQQEQAEVDAAFKQAVINPTNLKFPGAYDEDVPDLVSLGKIYPRSALLSNGASKPSKPSKPASNGAPKHPVLSQQEQAEVDAAFKKAVVNPTNLKFPGAYDEDIPDLWKLGKIYPNSVPRDDTPYANFGADDIEPGTGRRPNSPHFYRNFDAVPIVYGRDGRGRQTVAARVKTNPALTVDEFIAECKHATHSTGPDLAGLLAELPLESLEISRQKSEPSAISRQSSFETPTLSRQKSREAVPSWIDITALGRTRSGQVNVAALGYSNSIGICMAEPRPAERSEQDAPTALRENPRTPSNAIHVRHGTHDAEPEVKQVPKPATRGERVAPTVLRESSGVRRDDEVKEMQRPATSGVGVRPRPVGWKPGETEERKIQRNKMLDQVIDRLIRSELTHVSNEEYDGKFSLNVIFTHSVKSINIANQRAEKACKHLADTIRNVTQAMQSNKYYARSLGIIRDTCRMLYRLLNTMTRGFDAFSDQRPAITKIKQQMLRLRGRHKLLCLPVIGLVSEMTNKIETLIQFEYSFGDPAITGLMTQGLEFVFKFIGIRYPPERRTFRRPNPWIKKAKKP